MSRVISQTHQLITNTKCRSEFRSKSDKIIFAMASSFPPSYDEAIGEAEDPIYLGKPEDLAFAESLVKNSTVFAALRPSEDSVDLNRVKKKSFQLLH